MSPKTQPKGKTRKKKKRPSLTKQYQQSFDDRDSGSGGNRVLDLSKVSIEGDLFFKVESDRRYKINIIPFEIKTKLHPSVANGKLEIGDYHYLLDVWVHIGVGPGKASVLCPAKNYGKKCPICEMQETLKSQNDDKGASSFKARRRVFYNVQNLREDLDHVQIFETSHFLFEKELISEAMTYNDDGSCVRFADIDDGSVVVFRTEEDNISGQTFAKFKSFQFKERDEEIEDEILDSAVSLDELLVLHSYDELRDMLHGEDFDEEDDEDDDIYDAVEEDDDEEEEEKPPVKKRKPKSSGTTKKKSAKKDKCPHGHTFAEDCEEYEECDDCELWEKCVRAKSELEE